MAGDSDANAALTDRFYEAFGRRDHATMATCYAPDATFTDEVFKDSGSGRLGRSGVA